MKLMNEWFNDSEFWEHFAPIMFDDAHWAEVPAVADGITRLARLPLYRADRDVPGNPADAAGPRCLDLCCGFGRIALELARRGFSVTGVDITESYLRTAREDADYDRISAEFVLEDVRSFKRDGTFDIALNLYNSFGYFENPNDDRLMVQNAFDSLKRGGTFMIETLGREIVVRDFIEREWFERAGFYVLTEYESFDSWSALRNTWILIDKKNGQKTEKTFVHRLYAASELRRLLLDSGFARVEMYGDWDESRYDRKSDKLIVVGRKT
jgi:2-polyprenyl-3-methyl-5-hydroxy-6-metoxy-1,4-benzoquinol methylase